MRKLLIALIVLVVLVGGAGGVAYWYVSPSQPLDLAYEEVPLEHRAIQMISRMSLDLELTQEDVNNLGKKQIAAQPEYQPGVLVTGAKFRLEGGKLIADVNAKWRDRVPVGLTIVYRLNWQSPNLIAEVESAKLKDIELPAGAVGDVVIPLGNELPKLLKVKDVRIENDHAVVEFRRPSMQELGQLLG